MYSFSRKENGSSEGFGNLPKVTQVISNLDLNPDPPRSVVHAVSTRTKAQEQKIMEGASGSQKRQEGGGREPRCRGFSPWQGDDWRGPKSNSGLPHLHKIAS